MRDCKKNLRKLQYATYNKNIEVYKKDSDGNIIYTNIDGEQIPVIVSTMAGYNNPISFEANISAGKGQADIEVFGNNVDFSHVISTTDTTLPIDTLTRIWYENEPNFNADGTIDIDSADYVVKSVAKGLNSMKIAIKSLSEKGSG